MPNEQMHLDNVAGITNVQDVQSLRIQKPALLWVYMPGCHWCEKSAEQLSQQAQLNELPVQSINGIQHRANLQQSGFAVDAFPTVFLLKNNQKAVQFPQSITKANLEAFVGKYNV